MNSGPAASGSAHVGGRAAERQRVRRSFLLNLPTIGDIVGEIAARHDLVPQVDPILRDVVLPHVDQVAESDIGLLRRLADRQLDVVAKPANGRLLFVRRQVLASAEGSPSAPAVRISRTDTVGHRVLRADRDAYAAVTAQWHDVASAEPQVVRVGEPEGGPVFELPELFPDLASARNGAATKLRRLQRGSGTGEVTLALGRPELAADVPLLLEGWGGSGDGSWIATRVEHTFTPTEGLRTRVEIEAVTTPWNRASSAPPPEAPFGRPDVPASGARAETTAVDFSETPPVDQIDPAPIRWLHTDVSAWPIASQVLRVSVGERDVCIDHTAAGSWPTSALGSILVEGNAWIFAQVDGVWYGATWSGCARDRPARRSATRSSAPTRFRSRPSTPPGNPSPVTASASRCPRAPGTDHPRHRLRAVQHRGDHVALKSNGRWTIPTPLHSDCPMNSSPLVPCL